MAHPRTGTNFLCNMLVNRKDANYLGEYYPDQIQGQYNIIDRLFHGEPDGLKWGRYSHKDKPIVPSRMGLFAKTFYLLYVAPSDRVNEDPQWDILNNIKNEGLGASTRWDLAAHIQRRGIGVTTRWDLLEYIKEKRIGVLHLRRRNLVDTALSLILSWREKNYIFKPYNKNPIEVTPSYLAHHIWIVEWQSIAVQAALEKAGVRRLDIWYEDMSTDPQATMDRVADYLHRPRMDVVITKPTIKQRQGSQRDYILHYDKLKAKFAGSAYEQYFTD